MCGADLNHGVPQSALRNGCSDSSGSKMGGIRILRDALRAALTRCHEPLNSSMTSAPKQAQARRGIRISCEIPITLTRLDPVHRFSERCLTLLVNPQGCAARFCRPLEISVQAPPE